MLFDDRLQAEAAAWQAFVRQLGDHLSGQWPAMPERLGERYPAFMEAMVEQGLRRGLQDAAAVARWVNLCFAWGPAFDEKPGFSWAADILSQPQASEWLRVHQLVSRSALELERQASARLSPGNLLAADRRLTEVFAAIGRHGELLSASDGEQERALVACDLEALELQLADQPPRLHYSFDGEAWSRQPVPAVAPWRLDLRHPLPARLHLLSPAVGAPVRLRVRVLSHAVCDHGRHPAFRCTGPLGASTWSGQDSRAIALELLPRVPPMPAWGAGTWVAEETAPEYHKLEAAVCGLRDAGPVLGPMGTLVAVWPACQWWSEWQRAEPAPQALLGTADSDGRASARTWLGGGSRARVERDGQAQDAGGWLGALDKGLDTASSLALKRLAHAWAHVDELQATTLEASWGQLLGRASLAWGWHTSALDQAPCMRLLGRLDVQAALIDLAFRGTLAWGGAKARLELRCAGRAPLLGDLHLEATVPRLGEQVIAAASVDWRFPFEAQLAPLAAPGGALLQASGAVSGAVLGRAGLRPNTHGGSGFEWFAEVRLEAVCLPVVVLDPVAGQQRGCVQLLPEMDLLTWSLGDG